MSYYAYGILQEDYNIKPYLVQNDTSNVRKITDFKSVKNTTIIDKNNIFDRANNLTSSIEKIKTVNRINLYDQAKREAHQWRGCLYRRRSGSERSRGRVATGHLRYTRLSHAPLVAWSINRTGRRCRFCPTRQNQLNPNGNPASPST